MALGELTDRLTTAQDDQRHVQEELERLQEVASMTEPGTVDAESDVAISFHGVAVAVELEVHSPQLVTTVTGEGPKDREERNTGS